MALYNNDSIYNSDHFDLTRWRLCIPVDENGGDSGLAVTIADLKGYESRYFYDAPDGAMVFDAPVGGAETTTSQYARSELREMNGSSPAAWTVAQGGTMTATLKIDSVPKLFDGTPGKEVIGQIHGQRNELCRLYWDNNQVYFRDDVAGSHNDEMKFTPVDTHGDTPKVSLGEKFSYLIDAHGNTLTVKVYANDSVYSASTRINSFWQSDKFYFKAGAYLGVNETQGTGIGQDSFYRLDYGHTAGSGLGGLSSTAAASMSGNATMGGTRANGVLTAGAKTETAVHGGAAKSPVESGTATDLFVGGAAADRFDFSHFSGNSRIVGFPQGVNLLDPAKLGLHSLDEVSHAPVTSPLFFDHGSTEITALSLHSQDDFLLA